MNASRGMKSFDDYEMEPSPQVWEKIKQNIPSPRRKRRIAAWWYLAASVAGIAFLGLYFFEFDIKLRGKPTPEAQGTAERTVETSSPASAVITEANHPPSSYSASGQETTTQQARNAGMADRSIRTVNQDPGSARTQSTTPARSSHSVVASVSTEKNTQVKAEGFGAGSWNGSAFGNQESSVEKLSGIAFYLPAPTGSIPEKLSASSGDVTLAPRRNSSSRWQWSAMGSVENSYRNLRIDDTHTMLPPSSIQDDLDANETALRTFSTSVTAGYSFSTHFSLVSGLSMFSAGQQRSQSQVVTKGSTGGQSVYGITTSAGVVTGSGQQFDEAFFNNHDSTLFVNTSVVPDQATDKSFELEQQFQYVSIPLMVQYQLAERRFTPYIGVGFSAAYLTGEKITLNGNELDYQYGEQLHDFLFSAEAQAGIKYRFTRHLSAGVQPSFRYGLNSLNGNDRVQWIPYSFGIGFGINYRY